MTGLLVLSADPSANLGAATKQYVDAAESDAVATAESYTDGEITTALSTAQGYADTAEADAISAAESYTDGEITTALSTAQGYANTAEQNAIAHADALTTSDVAEGTAQYFTDARAKSSAAALLTGASLTNITITGTGEGLTITAENGVADSDTDDLEEGLTNLYFTNVRAVDALEAVVPNFTAVELNSVAKQVAATLSAPTAGVQIAHAFAKAEYRSAEYLVKVAYSTHTEISKVLLTLDSSDNISVTEYGIVGTNGSLSAISATVSGSNVQLLVDTEYNDSTVTVVGTLVA
jgi:Holliday junction resolvasome RuvABC endonuclease subunit